MLFSHLHCHTQFSLLDGAADIKKMLAKAKADNMPACAITDHGNMFGVFQFVAEAHKQGIKPIVGCEFYVVENMDRKQFSKDDKDKRYHQLLLAKNANGYKNLIKLCSLGYTRGQYGKYPRIDKKLVELYHEDLIATTCCLGAMVPQYILKKSEAEAEVEFKWWLDLFGDDYYIELQRHHMPEQNQVNEVLLRFAKKYERPIIATNDSHYIEQEDNVAHDILLCINTGEKLSTPTLKEFSDDDVMVKDKRFAFFNDQFYFKKTEEMSALFHDLPQAIDNTNLIVDKIEPLDLKRNVALPNYEIPKEFLTQDSYLRHLTLEGAKTRYSEFTQEVEERLNFELGTIETMGFAGYFLIVQDFINHGKDIGVFVGPGRGSAAGSAVAFCLGITNIDPLKYNLLFERFLNPDRKSLPDIDTDFDDEGRQRVIDYVVEKYGKTQVAQIVTYGSMAAKMSIKDVARVMELPIGDSNALAKLVPDRPGTNLNAIMKKPFDELKDLASEDIDNVKKLREILKQDSSIEANVLKQAMILEGSVRGTGVHAAGIIIAPEDLTNLIPIATAKDSSLYITQYGGNVIEDAGVIKMDFLGLRTLSILKTALSLIKANHDVIIDLDTIPLDDLKTLQLYQRGDTIGTFQFESVGMQKYLRELKPDRFEDLIAMNALYRPGPIAYIPNFISRKHGREKVTYDLPVMEESLKETYGITVYQEQVMLLSRNIAGFSKGEADFLRKAMGKKDLKTLTKMKAQFLSGATEKGHPAEKLEKIWTDWEAFASYAFNKSHSTAYSVVAFQTAYLKAHYPSEYMSAVLTHNKDNIDKVAFFMEECKRMGIEVLGPDVNESNLLFTVNKKGAIRFGLGGVKSVGENPSLAIIEEREKNGIYKSIFDLTSRVNLKSINKRVLEPLVMSGAFDSIPNTHRRQYFFPEDDREPNTIEKALRYGANKQESANSNQASLFGGSSDAPSLAEPVLPRCEPWVRLEELKKEREVVGMYISGHPLDDFKFEIKHFTKGNITAVKSAVEAKREGEFTIAGIVTTTENRMTKTSNKPWMKAVIEDYDNVLEIALFTKDYENYGPRFKPNNFLLIKGRINSRYGSETEKEFKISSVEHLGDVREKMMKQFLLQVSSLQVNAPLIDGIENIAKNNPGNCNFKLLLNHPQDNMMVELLSKKYRININRQVLDEFEALGLERYRINDMPLMTFSEEPAIKAIEEFEEVIEEVSLAD
jgi:DNA polymerase-3 subunit alpha